MTQNQTLRRTFTVLVGRFKDSFRALLTTPVSQGRTGRFGRKGISINFVHDRRTWSQMEEIEKTLNKKIIRIETNDLEEMEEVRA
jgi:hypothetical protein